MSASISLLGLSEPGKRVDFRRCSSVARVAQVLPLLCSMGGINRLD